MYLIAFSVTIIVLLWIFQTICLNFFYKQHQLKTINSIATTIVNTEEEELFSIVEELAYDKQVCIEIVDTKLKTSKGFNNLMHGCLLGKSNTSVDRSKQEIIRSEEAVKGYQLENAEKEVKAILLGVEKDNYHVFIFSNLEDITATSIIIKGQLVYIMLVAILFAILIACFLSHKLTDPIAKITKQAKKFAKGDYNIKFEKNGITEIDDLADTLSYVGKEFAKTDEMRRDLMANVSHDLKTPLTMIKAYSEMIRDISYKNIDKRNEHLQIIIDETDRLNLLVNDILELSKIQSEVGSILIEEYDLTKEIKSIIKCYEIIKETEEYKLEVSIPRKCLVSADKHRINQVMYNLINNAINYTGVDKTVKIQVTDQEEYYLVEIIDTGKGIKSEDMKRIWDKYYKNEKNHKRNLVGTGLGLSIVKGVLESHDFDYGVTTKKNIGSTFYFKIRKCK